MVGLDNRSKNHPARSAKPFPLRGCRHSRKIQWVLSARNSAHCCRVNSTSRQAIHATAITIGHRDCFSGSNSGNGGSEANGGQPFAFALASASSGFTSPKRAREIRSSRFSWSRCLAISGHCAHRERCRERSASGFRLSPICAARNSLHRHSIARLCPRFLSAQPVDATQALNLSAGVSNCKVSRGRSFS